MAIVAAVRLKLSHFTLWRRKLWRFLKPPHFTKITVRIYIVFCSVI